MTQDPYAYSKQLKTAFSSLESDKSVLPKSKETIAEFLDAMKAQNLSQPRILFYLNRLKVISRMMGKTFRNPTRKDVEKLLREIDKKTDSMNTRKDYRVAVKRFYKWHLGEDEEYPNVVRWIKTTNGQRRTLPKDILTTEERKALISACLNPRDRAFISLLADSGCRVGEVLTLLQKDLTFDQYGLILIVSGKTGGRRVRVVGDSIAHVSAWLDVHPKREPEAPLFVGMDGRTNGRPMNYPAARKALRTAKERAGIKKRIHAHLFRHTRATELAANVAEAPLEDQMGWVHGSRMAQTYVHLSGRDVDRAILAAEGIEMEEEKEDKERNLPKACPRCEAINANDSRYCRRCSLPLSLEAALEVQDAMTEIAGGDVPALGELKTLLENPQVREFLKLLGTVEPHGAV
jgi:integrase/ribosomal protein L40E